MNTRRPLFPHFHLLEVLTFRPPVDSRITRLFFSFFPSFLFSPSFFISHAHAFWLVSLKKEMKLMEKIVEPDLRLSLFLYNIYLRFESGALSPLLIHFLLHHHSPSCERYLTFPSGRNFKCDSECRVSPTTLFLFSFR